MAMKMTTKDLELRRNEADMVTRYFLRWLAVEHRKKHVGPHTPYRNAMMEVIGQFIMAPIFGILGFVGLATLKWWAKTPSGDWIANSKYTVVLIILIFSILIGRNIFKSKLGRYKDDPDAPYIFDSERDARVAEWQRKAVYYFCGGVMPCLGLLVTYLTGG